MRDNDPATLRRNPPRHVRWGVGPRIVRPLAARTATLALGLFMLVACPAAAQQQTEPTLHFNGLLGTGVVDTELGLTTGVGAALIARHFATRMLLELHLMQPDDSGYTWELGSDGPECREDDTGLLVDGSFCSISRTFTGLSTEASVVLPAFGGGFHLGGGYRFGTGSTPYGAAGYAFNPADGTVNLLFRLIAGRDLFGFQAVASLPIRTR